jgi:hypothetical protein
MTRVFILHGLQKALAIDLGAAQPHKLPPDAILIPTTLKEAQQFFYDSDPLQMLSVDIECNPDTQELTCIGFATKMQNGALSALVIPLQHEANSYWSEADENIYGKS